MTKGRKTTYEERIAFVKDKIKNGGSPYKSRGFAVSLC